MSFSLDFTTTTLVINEHYYNLQLFKKSKKSKDEKVGALNLCPHAKSIKKEKNINIILLKRMLKKKKKHYDMSTLS